MGDLGGWGLVRLVFVVPAASKTSCRVRHDTCRDWAGYILVELWLLALALGQWLTIRLQWLVGAVH